MLSTLPLLITHTRARRTHRIKQKTIAKKVIKYKRISFYYQFIIDMLLFFVARLFHVYLIYLRHHSYIIH